MTVTCEDDLPVAVDDMATVTEDAAATAIAVLGNDTDVDAGPKFVDSVTQPAGGTVVNNGTDVSYTPDPDFCNDGSPTDDFTYTLNGGSTATVAVTVICVSEPPVVTAPGPFDVTGNVQIQVPDGASDLLSNVGGDTPFTISSATAMSTNSTVVNVSINTTSGAFSYNPPPGFEGADSFDYEVCGPGGCDAGTVNLTVGGMIWFVDASATGGGDGSITDPFNCLTGTGCFDPVAADDAGDNIFLADGSYTGGLLLLNNQRLIGDGSSSDLATITGISLPAFSDSLPVFSGTDPVVTSSANGINLGSGNTIRGLTIGDITFIGLSGTTVGTLVVSEVTIGDGTPSGAAIAVTTSGTLDVAFDNLSANSINNAGIRLWGVSGSFSISGITGTIQTTGVSAIDINGNASLAINMTFASVSASGGNAGIVLRDTTGNFTVTGDGSTAGSGGTIQNMTGANGSGAGTGIWLNNSQNISLNFMQLNDHQNFAIRGTDVINFDMANSVVNGVNGNSSADDEGSIRFTDLTGTVSITGSTIAGGHEDNIRINNSSGILTINVEDSLSNQMVIGLNSTVSGNDGILLETTGTADATMTIAGVEFLGARGDMVQTNALGNSIQDISIENSTFLNAHTNIVSAGGGITLSGGSNTSDIMVAYSVDGNEFSGAKGNAITANYLSNAGAVDGMIQNNLIGTGVAASGSSAGSGIAVGAEKNGAGGGNIVHTVLIDNNTIQEVDGFAGIDIISNRGTGTGSRAEVNATVTNNSVFGLGGFLFTGMNLAVGGSGAGDFSLLCADIRNNIIDASGGTFATNAVFFDQISTVANHNLPGYAGSSTGEFAATPGTASADISTHLNSDGNILTNGVSPLFPLGSVDAGFVDGVSGDGSGCP